MIQNEQILEYIDGLLGPDAEQALFDAMARQPELRSALRQFISIGDAIRSDREAYTPPSDVERALMNNLGLGNLAPYAGAPAVSGAISRLSSFGSRFWGMMMSFLLGALLAGSTAVYVMSDTADNRIVAGREAPDAAGDAVPGRVAPGGAASERMPADKRSPGAVPQSGAAMADASGDGDEAAGMNGNTAGTANAPSGGGNGERLAEYRTRSGRSNASSTASGAYRSDRTLGGGSDNRRRGGGGASAPATVSQPPALADRSDGNSGIAPLPDVTPVQPRQTDQRAEIPRESLMDDAPSRAPQEPLPLAPEPDGDADHTRSITLEARLNLGGAYNPNNALRNPSPTDDLMGAVFFHPTNSFALGLELGKESYDQTLYSVSTDTLQVEQRPSYLWFGATGRLYLGELPFNNIETFVQGTAAYSTGGPVVRLRLGGRMPVSPAWDVTFGLETAGLIYTFQDRQSVSGRWGISGGVQWTLW